MAFSPQPRDAARGAMCCSDRHGPKRMSGTTSGAVLHSPWRPIHRRV